MLKNKSMEKITSYRIYTDKEDYYRFAAVRVSNNLIKNLGGRHSWVLIETDKGKRIYRTIRGAGNKDIKTHQIEIDYDSIIELDLHKSDRNNGNSVKNESGYKSCNVKLKRIGFPRKIVAHFKHPDPAYRTPMQLAMIMSVVGFISLLLGIISIL